ncbi:MAG: hypothetical protein BWY77_01034 [bacterium ADurb.Bin431]|nr:MAG: hypothetical protein BWY77_01034 [bacterium ADurb.Bin431]
MVGGVKGVQDGGQADGAFCGVDVMGIIRNERFEADRHIKPAVQLLGVAVAAGHTLRQRQEERAELQEIGAQGSQISKAGGGEEK